jgi:hypothetical protein
MPSKESAWAADLLVKLQRALPRCAGDDIDAFVSLSVLLVRVAGVLPGHDVQGLGEGQQRTVAAAVAALMPTVMAALHSPLTRLTPAIVELLRCLAHGSAAAEREVAFEPTGRFLPGDFRTHRFGKYALVKEYVDGLARAELGYEVMLEGTRRMRQLDTPVFWEQLDEGMHDVGSSMSMWALTFLFDGLRLRRGLEVAAPCGLLKGGSRAPFGLDSTAASLLSDGEASVDRERVGRAAQFLSAAARAGLRDIYDPAYNAEHGGPERGPPRDGQYKLYELEKRIAAGLKRCQQESEQRCLTPGKSMRIILSEIAGAAEEAIFCPGCRLMIRVAFLFPCLVPKCLRPLEGYDGGLLSVWDACIYLLKLHASEKKELLPMHALLCAVLGGVVGNLVSDTITGPFVVHPDCDVMREIERLNDEWPSGKKLPAQVGETGSELVRLHRRGDGPTTARGKMVGATVAICDAIERQVFKAEPRLTSALSMRAAAALMMHTMQAGFAQLPGVFESGPTDGIVAIKRLYFAALHCEPGFPEGPDAQVEGWVCPRPTSPFMDGVACASPKCVPPESIEMVWRELVGGASLCTGSLSCFTRKAFEASLLHDWKPRPAVARALEARELDGGGRPTPVMRPGAAMQLVAERAVKLVADVVTSIDNNVHATDGAPYAVRVAESLNAWSNSVYTAPHANPLWESAITHFCSPMAPRKRARGGDTVRTPAVC